VKNAAVALRPAAYVVIVLTLVCVYSPVRANTQDDEDIARSQYMCHWWKADTKYAHSPLPSRTFCDDVFPDGATSRAAYRNWKDSWESADTVEAARGLTDFDAAWVARGDANARALLAKAEQKQLAADAKTQAEEQSAAAKARSDEVFAAAKARVRANGTYLSPSAMST
jgi:hypothetical protein